MEIILYFSGGRRVSREEGLTSSSCVYNSHCKCKWVWCCIFSVFLFYLYVNFTRWECNKVETIKFESHEWKVELCTASTTLKMWRQFWEQIWKKSHGIQCILVNVILSMLREIIIVLFVELCIRKIHW